MWRTLQATAVIGDDGQVSVLVDGRQVMIDAYIAEQAGHFSLIPAPADAPSAPDAPKISKCGGFVLVKTGSSARWMRRGDTMTTVVTGWQAAEGPRLAQEAATWPNPWRKGAENRTRQTIIINIDSERVAILKSQTGVQ